MGRMTSNPAIPALDEDIRGQAVVRIERGSCPRDFMQGSFPRGLSPKV